MSKKTGVSDKNRGWSEKYIHLLSVCVLHAAVLANAQPFTSGLQLSQADLFILAGEQALGHALMRGGHGAVARSIFLALLLGMLGHGGGSGQGTNDPKDTTNFHGFTQQTTECGYGGGAVDTSSIQRASRAKVLRNFATLGAATAMQ